MMENDGMNRPAETKKPGIKQTCFFLIIKCLFFSFLALSFIRSISSVMFVVCDVSFY